MEEDISELFRTEAEDEGLVSFVVDNARLVCGSRGGLDDELGAVLGSGDLAICFEDDFERILKRCIGESKEEQRDLLCATLKAYWGTRDTIKMPLHVAIYPRAFAMWLR